MYDLMQKRLNLKLNWCYPFQIWFIFKFWHEFFTITSKNQILQSYRSLNMSRTYGTSFTMLSTLWECQGISFILTILLKKYSVSFFNKFDWPKRRFPINNFFAKQFNWETQKPSYSGFFYGIDTNFKNSENCLSASSSLMRKERNFSE